MTSPFRLGQSLAELVDYLRASPGTDSAAWVQALSTIQAGILKPDGRAKALAELQSCFGGMGTLNDLVFSRLNGNLPDHLTEAQANEEFGHLLDRCFRELRLVNGSKIDRLRWWWLEWRHRRELPPRIKSAFDDRAV
jgi:hypothetical protein